MVKPTLLRHYILVLLFKKKKKLKLHHDLNFSCCAEVIPNDHSITENAKNKKTN